MTLANSKSEYMNPNFFEVSSEFWAGLCPTDPYQAKVWHFCHNWLDGQAIFEIKTSGSTGPPKTIQLTRIQMQASAQLTGVAFGLKQGDAALACLHIDYIAGMMMVVRALELGLQLTVIEPASNPLATLSSTKSFDLLAFVPLQLQKILTETPEYNNILNQAKAILIGGAAVSSALHHQLQIIQAPVFSTYGMTETVSHIAIRLLNGAQQSEKFTALQGVQLGIDHRRCLNIRAAATNFELIQTNDVVELVDEQTFTLVGRYDNIINSGSLKIQLEKIENECSTLLSQLHWNNRIFAIGEPDEVLGERLVLVIESLHGWEQAVEIQFRNALSKKLNRYELPKRFYYCGKFLETPTGKIDKKATFALKHTLFTNDDLTTKQFRN